MKYSYIVAFAYEGGVGRGHYVTDKLIDNIDEFVRMEESVRESQDLKKVVVFSFQYLGEYQGGEDE